MGKKAKPTGASHAEKGSRKVGKGQARSSKHNSVGNNDNDEAQSETSSKGQRGDRGKNDSNKKNKKKNSFLDVDDEKLRRAVEGDGSRQIMDMEADGNCLFRSISDQLYWDHGSHHADVRSDVCDYLAAHEEEFRVFLVLDDDDEDAKDFETYVENMRQDGEWGGNLELVVAARLYRRNITVFSANLAAFTISHDDNPHKKSTGPDLLVSYHDNDHYNSVRNNSLKKPPLPPQRGKNRFETPPSSPLYAQRKQESKDKPHTIYDIIVEDGEGDHVEVVASSSSNTDCCDELNQQSEDNTPEESETPEKKALLENQNINPDLKYRKSTVKKGSPCPCGSGIKYKKCCLAKEKHAERLKKMRDAKEDDSDDEDGDENRDVVPVYEMNGDFRAIKI